MILFEEVFLGNNTLVVLNLWSFGVVSLPGPRPRPTQLGF